MQFEKSGSSNLSVDNIYSVVAVMILKHYQKEKCVSGKIGTI